MSPRTSAIRLAVILGAATFLLGADESTPLRTIATVSMPTRDLVAWANPVVCDSDANLYFLVAPFATPAEVAKATESGKDLALTPRIVLRISADGKKALRLDPGLSPKLANAKEISTQAITTDRDGRLFALVWVTRAEAGAGSQYIAGFDDKGKVQSLLEVDWHRIVVHQFAAFDSGRFLLRGRRTETSEPWTVVFSESGGLQEVVAWAPSSEELLDKETRAPNDAAIFGQLTPGGDGRIYVARSDPRLARVVVYAFTPAGQTDTILSVPKVPRAWEFAGLRVAGDRIAVTYQEAGTSGGDQGAGADRWWISVHDNAVDGPRRSLYGPLPSQPLCYQVAGGEDRFALLAEGNKLITKAP